jgi:hypothetical protein
LKFYLKRADDVINFLKKLILLQSLLMAQAVIAGNDQPSEGKIEAVYEACKDVLLVSEDKYEKDKNNWDQFEKACNTKIQLVKNIGISSLDPLKEGVQYLAFAQKVAQKIIGTLAKNRDYARCSSRCFSGALECASTYQNKKIVKCSERKNEIKSAMKIFGRKIRMELALSTDAPDLVKVTSLNALEFSKNEKLKEKFINTNLRDFEVGTPNPVGRIDLSERELIEAKRKFNFDLKKIQEEYEGKTNISYADWVSFKLMANMEVHKERYRELLYQEAPIFGVIDRPIELEKGKDPVWSDAQLAKAFLELAKNAENTEEKVFWSLKNSKLEFSRNSGEAALNWASNLAPGSKEKNDLLYYIGMKNPVEEVLKEDPSLCAVATNMQARLQSKEIQNTLATVGGSIGTSILAKSVSAVSGNFIKVTRALTGAEAAGMTGTGLGAISMSDSFRKYHSVLEEAETLSGLDGDKEGVSIRKSEEVVAAKDGAKTSLVFAPINAAGAWGVGKIFYSALSKQMGKDLPAVGDLLKKAKLDNVARDQVVDKWLLMKLKSAFKSGAINDADQAALQGQEARGVLEKLASEIEKSNPAFFKNPKNTDFFFKTAAATIKKEKGDPSDLGDKVQQLLLQFNTEAMSGVWDPKGQSALLRVFDNAITELRLSASNDPATYAKFNVDKASQEKIFIKALQRSGAKEKDLKAMVQCALPI